MSALFGYLLVIGLLLGGGYGALNWLAAPEPVKITTKSVQRISPRPHYPAESEPKSSELASATLSSSEVNSATTGGKEEPSSAQLQLQADIVAKEQGAQATVSALAQDRPSLSTNVQAPPVRAAGARDEASDGIRVTTAKAPDTEARKPTRKMASRDHHHDRYNDDAEWHDRHSAEQRLGSVESQYARAPHRGERDYPASRSLALMTLRTVEFPDGRRVSQLLPYRRTTYGMIPHPGGDGAPVLEPDE